VWELLDTEEDEGEEDEGEDEEMPSAELWSCELLDSPITPPELLDSWFCESLEFTPELLEVPRVLELLE
jgi:hypothetical protein